MSSLKVQGEILSRASHLWHSLHLEPKQTMFKICVFVNALNYFIFYLLKSVPFKLKFNHHCMLYKWPKQWLLWCCCVAVGF